VRFEDVTHLDLAELIRPTLITELSRSMTRARVQQYQRYFADADKVLILLPTIPILMRSPAASPCETCSGATRIRRL
jgi:hypothetical protein